MGAIHSEVRDGMQIDWDVPVKMDDGLILKADVFRPVGAGKYPVLLSYGPYAKGLSFQDSVAWQTNCRAARPVVEGNRRCTRTLLHPELIQVPFRRPPGLAWPSRRSARRSSSGCCYSKARTYPVCVSEG